MFSFLSFLAFLVLGANAQLCFPNDVGKVTLDLNYTLYWDASTNCEATHYLIYIHIEEDLQFIYTSDETFLDVSFLPACERFHFEVAAFSDNELSESVRLDSYIPAPSGADLAIFYFNASVQEGITFLQWQVTQQFAHCARAFRVVVFDGLSLPRDVYTDRNYLFLDNLIPCGQYEFAVMAIYNLQEEGPIATVNYEVPGTIASRPVLESVDVGDTYVNIRWGLPSYSENRCTIRSVVIDALPFLHQVFPVVDSPQRPLYTTSLTNLQSDSLYMLKVTIENSAGTSEEFPIGVQTAPPALIV